MDQVQTENQQEFSHSERETQYALPDLDFHGEQNAESLTTSYQAVPTPDEIPAAMSNLSDIPLEIKRSATVEALISQNDDMIARLKVSLRRLAQLENENDRLRQIHRVLETKNSALTDRDRVWEEKESLWQTKERSLEEKIQDFRTRLPEYESLFEKVERYKKYHERIKTQVKPFVQQLKTYADSLMLEIQKLNAELAAREAQIQSLRQDKTELQSELEKNRNQAESRQELLVNHYERLQAQALQEVRELQITIGKLELRAQAFDEVRAREDELTNVIVGLRRQKEDQYRDHTERENDLRAELAQIRSELTTLKEAQMDQTRNFEAANGEKNRLINLNQQLEEQLGSLRYLWNTKSDELEKNRASLAALERLNADLSRQLTDLRRASETELR